MGSEQDAGSRGPQSLMNAFILKVLNEGLSLQAGGKLARGNIAYALRSVWQEKGFAG